HSGLIVDFDLPHAVEVAKIAKSVFPARKPVLFGMLGAELPIGGVFQAGANFVLYKPLDLLQVLHSLRAAQGFMQSDSRRESRRQEIASRTRLNGTSEVPPSGCICPLKLPFDY